MADAHDDVAAPSRPLTRAERQEQTRSRLIDAARAVFAEDGYHGANLERIAHVAGFSKGAVYSNFEGKAQLFLAVMDANLARLEGPVWDLFAEGPNHEDPQPDGPTDGRDAPAGPDSHKGADPRARAVEGPEGSPEVAISGFALATLEFIASAARDPDLAPELSQRGKLLIDVFVGMAEANRAPDEPLSTAELGALLSAFDQGMALLSLTGAGDIDARHARVGLQRLANPARAAARALPEAGAATRAVHDRALQDRLLP